MLFSSNVFLFLFLPIVIGVYYIILKKRRSRNLFLLAASIGFYTWGEPWFVMVMILSIGGNWAFGLFVDKFRNNKRKAQLIIIAMLLMNFSIMFICKYLIFTLQNINRLMNTDILIPTIVLPIGISFFTFQAVSYVIDVYRQDAEVQVDLFNVALYISLFPQLIAGPIVRYKTVEEQINHRIESFDDFSYGVEKFVIGLGKKVLIANNMAIVADKAFNLPSSELSVSFSWLGIFAYTFQIFFDFSGYSDMAIGLGRMFGFRFMENFNYPYISKSITEFWRRWHISLSTWFRDYVYFPMGGSKVKTKSRLVFNLFIVWSLTGIWHGANWTFIAWGVLYFMLLSIEKLTGINKKLKSFGHIYTLFFVIIGWVLFRSESISTSISYIKIMFGASSAELVDSLAIHYLKGYIVFYIIAIVFSMPLMKMIEKKVKKKLVWDIMYTATIIMIFILSVSAIVNSSYNPFIYFNF
ncbi:MBOAT family protein [Clostridiaceae bacterium HSG29]|nr:MBOAT family protein [Clostridiaceae bacterium HSG29]